MKKHHLHTADLQKKPYVKPQINVVEIKEADIICTSDPSSSTPFVFGSDENGLGFSEATW